MSIHCYQSMVTCDTFMQKHMYLLPKQEVLLQYTQDCKETDSKERHMLNGWMDVWIYGMDE